MREVELMMSTPSVPYPDPPEGYQPAVRFQYPTAKLQIAAIVVLVLTTPLLLLLTMFLQRWLHGKSFEGVQGIVDLLLILVTVLAITTIHELVHGMAYQLLGYQVSYGVSKRLIAAYAAAFGQWQTRTHNMLVALTPLTVLTVLFLPLVCVPYPRLVLVGLAALLMNIGGSVGDVYLAWRLARLPRRTLLYDIDTETMLIYLPADLG
jgi:hypothetical protein